MFQLVQVSTWQGSINSLVCIYYEQNVNNLIELPQGSQPFSEHLRQANISVLALRVVTAKASGSFTSKTECGPTLL